jgi:hypothetical protein
LKTLVGVIGLGLLAIGIRTQLYEFHVC